MGLGLMELVFLLVVALGLVFWVWMLTEAAVGLWQGMLVGSIALTGWALGSAVEGLASVIVVWRFSGARTLSETAERRAQRGVAVSFWLIAPYIAAVSLRNLLGEHFHKRLFQRIIFRKQTEFLHTFLIGVPFGGVLVFIHFLQKVSLNFIP